jgi:hypothetical protein
MRGELAACKREARMEWLAGLVICAALGGWLLFQIFKPSPSGPEPRRGGGEGVPASAPMKVSRVLPWEGDGDYETKVDGESLYQDALLSIVGEKTEESQEFETRAVLTPESFNGNRLYAVLIEGKKVGYLEAPMTAVLNAMVERNDLGVVAFEVEAMITGGWKRAGSEGMFGVVLDLVDEDVDDDD